MSYRIAFGVGASNINSVIKGLADAGINLVHAYCEFWSDASVFSLLQKCVDNGIKAIPHLVSANDPDPFDYGGGCKGDGYIIRFATFKNAEGLFGLSLEEPYMRGSGTPEECQAFYSYAKSQNPDWKIYCPHADDEWNRHGYNIEGYCDLCGTDIYPCQMESPAGYLTAKLEGLSYRDAHRNMYDSWGVEVVPALMAWSDVTCPDCILEQYQTWKSVIDRPIGGVAYYKTSGFLPVAGGLECIHKQVRSLNFTYLEAPFKLSGSVSFEKSLTIDVFSRTVKKLLYGSLGFTSSLSEYLSYPLSGSLNFIGISAKKLFSNLFGSLSFSGDIDTPFWETFYKTCDGAITFSQTLSQKVKRDCLGAVTFSQVLSQKVKTAFSSLLNFTGLLYTFSAGDALCLFTFSEIQSLTYSNMQTYTYGLAYTLRVGGLVSFSADCSRKARTYLSGVFSFSGDPFLKINTLLSGALSSSGAFVNIVKTLLSSSLTYSGIVKRTVKNFILSGALSPSGKVIKSGYASFVGLLRRLIQLLQSED